MARSDVGMAVGLEAERRAEQDTGVSSEEWMQSRDALFEPFAERFKPSPASRGRTST